MRKLLTLLINTTLFCEAYQLVNSLNDDGMYDKALEDFIFANDVMYWDQSDVDDFVLAVYS